MNNGARARTGALGVVAVILGLAVLGSASEDKPTANSLATDRPLRLSGTIVFRASAEDPGRDGFSVSKARLSLSGELFKNATFKLQMEAVPDPRILDAQMDLAFHKAVSVRIGQFKVPFSQENIYTDTDLDTIKRSQPVVAMCPGYDTDSSGRDIGVTFHGTSSIWEYTVGIFNGEGINKAPDGKAKDLAGRLRLIPTDFLAVGLSFYGGRGGATAPAPRKERAGLEMTFDIGTFSLKGEYIRSRDDDLERRGWYLQAAYFFLGQKLQGVFKVDSYDPDTHIAGSRTNLWTIGLNWFFASKVKFQINYSRYVDAVGRTTKTSLMAQIRGGF